MWIACKGPLSGRQASERAIGSLPLNLNTFVFQFIMPSFPVLAYYADALESNLRGRLADRTIARTSSLPLP